LLQLTPNNSPIFLASSAEKRLEADMMNPPLYMLEKRKQSSCQAFTLYPCFLSLKKHFQITVLTPQFNKLKQRYKLFSLSFNITRCFFSSSASFRKVFLPPSLRLNL